MEFGTIEIKKQKFEVHLNSGGQFGARFPSGDTEYFPSLDELRNALTKELAKKEFKTAIPFVKWVQGALKRGVATGLHARTNHVLVRWEDGTTAQVDNWGWRSGEFLRIPTPELEAEFVHVNDQAKKFEDRRRELVETYKFDIKTEIQNSLTEVIKKDAGGSK